ncbi:MAG: hypothetical protein QM704_12920 [Anaeromyxobacteraceae bacterium]
MVERLAERGAGVAEPVLRRADVGVRVEVEHVDPLPRPGVAEEVAVPGLVPAAEHDDERSPREPRGDVLAERGLVALEVAGDGEVTGVERLPEERAEAPRGPGVRRELPEQAPDRGRALRGAGPPAVPAHAHIGREPEDHGPRRLAGREVAAEEVPHPRVVGGGRGQRGTGGDERVHGALHTTSPPFTVRAQSFGRKW